MYTICTCVYIHTSAEYLLRALETFFLQGDISQQTQKCKTIQCRFLFWCSLRFVHTQSSALWWKLISVWTYRVGDISLQQYLTVAVARPASDKLVKTTHWLPFKVALQTRWVLHKTAFCGSSSAFFALMLHCFCIFHIFSALALHTFVAWDLHVYRMSWCVYCT